jgi:sulfur-carrier protein
MEVEVRLFATLREYAPASSGGNRLRLRVESGEPVESVLRRIGIPAGRLVIVLVDGVRGDAARQLKGGEVISLFPPLGGG